MTPYWASDNGDTRLAIHQGDALETLQQMPDESVHCVATSPPYWGLRDYGTDGQLGLEATPQAYVDVMVRVFREVRRVLRHDGTCWLNGGDSYSSGGRGSYGGGARYPQTREGGHRPPTGDGLKPKDLVGIPWMLAFALRADGWYLRSDIIWHKPNAMPESVTDRPTAAHEHIFLLSKAPRYYYDGDAIREPVVRGANGSKFTSGKTGAMNRHPFGDGERSDNPLGRNKRNVWTVSTASYSGAHFAVFPPRLIEPCILAGAAPQVCPHCGAPWERIVERKGGPPPGDHRKREDFHASSFDEGARGATGVVAGGSLSAVYAKYGYPERVTVRWEPSCACGGNDGSGRAVVLDPFLGSGTTLLVAQRLGRSGVGIELNAEYCDMAIERLAAEHRQVRLPIGGEGA